MFLSLLLTWIVLLLHSWRFPAASTNYSTFNPLLQIFSLTSSKKLLLGRLLLGFFAFSFFQRFSLALCVDCPPVFLRRVRDRTVVHVLALPLAFSILPSHAVLHSSNSFLRVCKKASCTFSSIFFQKLRLLPLCFSSMFPHYTLKLARCMSHKF